MQVLSTNVLLKIRLCTKSTTASTATIPHWNTLRACDVRLSTDELLLFGMDAPLMNDKVSLFGKATPTSWIFADVVAAILDVAMLDLHMSLEVAIGGADMATLRACGWVDRLNVLLHLNVRREADGSGEGVLVQTCIDVGHLGRADLTPETVTAVFAIPVGDQMSRRLEPSIAWQTSEAIELVANKRLLVQMNKLNVSVESVLLAEVLVARRKAGAEEVRLCVFMRLLVLL